MSILDINNSIATSNNVHFFISKITFLLVTLFISDIMNVIVTSKKAILDI